MRLNDQKYSKKDLRRKEKIYNAEVINFPKDKNSGYSVNLDAKNLCTWKLYDKINAKEDDDQLRAVTGICFMFVVLIVLGLYSNLI